MKNKTPMFQARPAFAALAAGFALTILPGTVGQALGQWAIGDGTALDRNLRVGDSRRIPTGRNFAAEAAFRNAIVTGNAPQGLRFRGEIDYTSPYEFRSSVGTELSDSFRRDSLFSGLAGYGIRGTDALQFQFAMTTGSVPPPSLTGTLTTHRFGGGVSFRSTAGTQPLGAVTSNTDTIRRADVVDPFLDERGKGLWTLRSTSAYASSRSYQPANLKLFETLDGNMFALTASSLRGIEVIPLGMTVDANNNSPGSLSGQRATRAGIHRETFPALSEDGSPDATGIGAYAGLNLHRELARRYDAYADWRRGGVPADTSDDWRKSVQTLREYLASGPPPLPDANATGRSNALKPTLPPSLTPGDIDLLRNAPGEYESLILRNQNVVDAYSLHMKAGEKLMAQGRFFDAEERFTRALAFAPGDEIASASRINAQIGAGLFVSAALNLRTQLRDHPETITLRLPRAMLPKTGRLSTLSTRLRSNIADDENRLQADSALLLAYIGYHTRDPVKTREGIEAFEAIAPGDRMGAVLRRLWLPDDTEDSP